MRKRLAQLFICFLGHKYKYTQIAMEPTAQNKNYVQASGQMGPNDICGPQDTETDPHAFKAS